MNQQQAIEAAIKINKNGGTKHNPLRDGERIRYVAMDCDRHWFGYTKKPRIIDHEWISGVSYGLEDTSDIDWECSLAEVPE